MEIFLDKLPGLIFISIAELLYIWKSEKYLLHVFIGIENGDRNPETELDYIEITRVFFYLFSTHDLKNYSYKLELDVAHFLNINSLEAKVNILSLIYKITSNYV